MGVRGHPRQMRQQWWGGGGGGRRAPAGFTQAQAAAHTWCSGSIAPGVLVAYQSPLRPNLLLAVLLVYHANFIRPTDRETTAIVMYSSREEGAHLRSQGHPGGWGREARSLECGFHGKVW